MKIVVVGTGYVGLSLAVLLARRHEVVAVDIDEQKIALVNSRRSPIADAELEAALREDSLNLSATTRLAEAAEGARIVVVATPTDYDPVDNFFDTSSVESVVAECIRMAPDATVVVKSSLEGTVHSKGSQSLSDTTVVSAHA